MHYLLLFTMSLVLVTNAHAQVYKWVDEDGNIQYTDHPPPSGSARSEKQLKIKKPQSSAVENTANTSESIDEKMQAFKERRDSMQEAEKKQKTAAIENNKRCVSAQGQLKIFRESPRLTFPDGKGGIVYADDEMRQKKIAEAQKNINSYCQ